MPPATAIRMVLTGDTMLAQGTPARPDDDAAAVGVLLRSADIAFTNLESCVREPHEGAANFTLGTPMTTPPSLLSDLKNAGIGIVSCANNHAADYGADGILATAAHLTRAKLPFAGAGATLAEARAPIYAETRGGKVALVAATAFFKPQDRASEARGPAKGRPGINPLGFVRQYTVDAAAFAALQRIHDELGLAQEGARHRAHFFSAEETPKDDAERLSFLGASFRRGPAPAMTTAADPKDAGAVLAAIAEAKRNADWVIFSFHNHELGGETRFTAKTDAELEEPGDFAVAFARAALDAGADIVAGHGPHLTLGVEIYKGKPILYSLGNFIFENDKIDLLPAESYARFGLGADATPADFFAARTGGGMRGFPATEDYWEGIAAEAKWRDGKLASLRLHPLDLGFRERGAMRGRPRIARGQKAARILSRVRRLSRHHGADPAMDGDTAVIRL